MTRQEANKKILKMIEAHINASPNWRFGQLIYNMGVIQADKHSVDIANISIFDPFHEESEKTLQRIIKIINTGNDKHNN